MPTTSPRSTGLRKFIPQPDRYRERYGCFTLTERDMEILETVHRYRYLEARHIRALVGGSDQQITRRLQGLFHNGYLGRYARRERMRLELDPGAPLIAYGLELNGARALERYRAATAATAGVDTEPVRWKKEYTRRTEWFLEHHLMVSNFRCALELALRDTPDTELLTWEQGKKIWFRVTIPGERKHTVRLAPDAYFVIRQRDQARHFYFEADRGTEERGRILNKFVAYWWHLQQCQRDGSPNKFRVNVLFVTSSADRLNNLVTLLQRMPKPNRTGRGGKGVFRFASTSSYDVGDHANVLDAFWRSTGGSAMALHER
jgi:hypothetical protein